MLGAIAGDIIGSVYEGKMTWQSARTPHFKPLFHPRARFTDDTVLTVAVADSILRGGDLVDLFKDYARKHPSAGYGGNFRRWAASQSRDSYNSWGNGAGMRVSPVGYACDSLDEVLLRAKCTAEVTHDHPEGIKGAQATAAAVFLARTGSGKDEIRSYIERTFGYRLDARIDDLRRGFTFNVSCQATVPPAIRVPRVDPL
jgi:ADP-ribosylglycohydrolase